jgi:uncharacterized protein YndB with AHSA1/START domain
MEPEISVDDECVVARVERSVRIDAPAGDVWRSLSDPDELSSWLGGEVELDRALRPGAAGVVRSDDGDRRLLVTEVEPGRRLVWHWWREEGELSSVELTLHPDAGATEVRVVEVVALAGATAGGSRASHRSDLEASMRAGWEAALPSLALRLARRLGALADR